MAVTATQSDPSRPHTSGSGDPYFPVESTGARGFGGTSNHWLEKGPFRARPLEAISLGGRDDIVDYPAWPVTRDELDPPQRRAHELFHLAGWDYAARPVGERRTARGTVCPGAVADVGLQAVIPWGVVLPLRRGSLPTRRSTSCSTRPWLASSPVAAATTWNASRCVFPGGSRSRHEPSTVVLAAGGLENPRVLLASDTGGLGNGHDLVGRYFMEHPQERAGLLHLTTPDAITTSACAPSGTAATRMAPGRPRQAQPDGRGAPDEHVLG